jgi:hypothetical protein
MGLSRRDPFCLGPLQWNKTIIFGEKCGFVVGAKKKKLSCAPLHRYNIVAIFFNKRQFVGISFFIIFLFFSGTLDKYGNLVLDSFKDDHHISRTNFF